MPSPPASPSRGASPASAILAAAMSASPVALEATPLGQNSVQGFDDAPHIGWGVPPERLIPMSPRSDLSFETFLMETLTAAYAYNQRVLQAYESTHPHPDDSDAMPTVRERWHREFGTNPDRVSSDYQNATVGGTDVFGHIIYPLVYPAQCFRRDDTEIQDELENRIQKRGTQLWIRKLHVKHAMEKRITLD
ncbi:hypothetical protein B0H17DRAFT_1137820 [Mycena rosella]|uniref:Uncharacterized protein n=1 Tax=Mycena rosella TaxID=1033263 RepID=A0AAD7DB42_MYCRO|nr:hypothetical protein B0H17DRAFT_1137820 [Mycena rosella]